MADKNIQDVLQDLHAAGENLLSLDVVTLVGDVTLSQVIKGDGSNRFHLDQIFQAIQGPDLDAKLRLVAVTHRGLDRDVTTIVGKDLSPAEQALLAAHNQLYAAAETARAEIVRLVMQLVPTKIG